MAFILVAGAMLAGGMVAYDDGVDPEAVAIRMFEDMKSFIIRMKDRDMANERLSWESGETYYKLDVSLAEEHVNPTRKEENDFGWMSPGKERILRIKKVDIFPKRRGIFTRFMTMLEHFIDETDIILAVTQIQNPYLSKHLRHTRGYRTTTPHLDYASIGKVPVKEMIKGEEFVQPTKYLGVPSMIYAKNLEAALADALEWAPDKSSSHRSIQ